MSQSYTDRSLRNKVSQLDDLAGVCVHERLEPRAGLVVLDLNDVREGERAVLLRNELERGRVLVELARELALSRGNRVLQGDRGRNRRDGG